MKLIGSFLLLFLCVFALDAQTTPAEIDQATQKALEQHRDAPKKFYNRLLELAALPNFNDAQKANFFLGYCYYAGYGTFTDTKAGKPYLLRAGELGSKEGYMMIALNYATRDNLSRAERKEKIEVNLKGAELGSPLCMWQLYYLYRDGAGSLKRDRAMAVRWLKQSATLEFPQACTQLGQLYQKGTDVDKDPAQAVRLFTQAANLEDKEAYVELSKCYRDGLGVGHDCAAANHWLDKALAEDYAEAQYEKGMNYALGECVDGINREEAKAWFRKAVAQNYSRAQWQLSTLEAQDNRAAYAEAQAQQEQAEAQRRERNDRVGWTYEEAIRAARQDMPDYGGERIDQDVRQGDAYSLEVIGANAHYLRFVVNEGTRPGYYPIIKVFYYDSDGELFGSYTTSSSDVKRYGEHLTLVQADIDPDSYGIRRVQFRIVRGSGRLISVVK